jgi:hypothetical protein
MMYILLAVPLAAAAVTVMLGSMVHRDFPDERGVWLALVCGPSASAAWSVLGYLLLEPFGMEVIWAYIAPFGIAFVAVAAALGRLMVLDVRPVTTLAASVLVLAATLVFALMMSGVLRTV